MAWNPALHPRWNDGRWRESNLASNQWYTLTDRRGKVHHYFLNDMNQLQDCQNIIAYGSRGRTIASNAHDTPVRTHIMATEDEEMMAVSATDHSVTGVIYHDKDAPPETMSLDRGSQWEPTPDYEGVKYRTGDGTAYTGEVDGFGGNGVQLSDRKDGRKYDTLNAQKAEQANLKAFESENSKTYHVDPGSIAEKCVEARHEYMKHDPDLSESQARQMPVFVYFDKDGEPQVKPAKVLNRKTGKYDDKHSPKVRGGSPTVKLTMDDVTRQTRALQADGVEDAQFAITKGTNVTKQGRPINNALHYRADFDDKNNHSVTAWGVIEKKNKGVEEVDAGRRFLKEDGTLDAEALHASRQRAINRRKRNAIPYHNPKDKETAVTLIKTRHLEENHVTEKDVTLRKDGTIAYDRGNGITTVYDANGEQVSNEANTPEAFASLWNQNMAQHGGKMFVRKENTVRLSDGNFRTRYRDPKGVYRYAYCKPNGARTPNRWRDPDDPTKVKFYDDSGRIQTAEANKSTL